MNCIICFSPLEEKYNCSDNKCNDYYCKDCIIDYIDFCHGESIMPKCPSKTCHCYLTLSNFKNIEKSAITKYNQLCMNYFLKDHGDIIEKQMQEKILLKKYRDDRKKFIKEEFPAGINLMANIAFKSKIKKLEKQKSKILKKQPKKRLCLNTMCSGYLNDDLLCCICESVFCKRCEKVISNDHQCIQEDLDSVNFVNGLIKCPGCHLPVFKNEGCDNITCSNCNASFLYKTGEKGGSGSHNTKLHINIEAKYKLSVLYKNKIPSSCIESLLELESLEPKPMSKDNLLVPVKKYIETKNEGMNKILSSKIDAYYQNKLKMKNYQYSLVQLENLLKKEEMSPVSFLNSINKYLIEFK